MEEFVQQSPPAPLPGGLTERIDKELLNQMPVLSFEGPVDLIEEDGQVRNAVREIREHERLGFDTETKPVFRRLKTPRNPALLQLTSKDKAWLFQLKKITNYAPLFELLASPRILKAGVAPRDDFTGLRRLHDFEPAGFVDISALAGSFGVVTTGLRNLAGMLLGGRILKGAQLSNWESDVLTERQIRYAATDAWISLKLYEKLEALLKKHPARAPAGHKVVGKVKVKRGVADVGKRDLVET